MRLSRPVCWLSTLGCLLAWSAGCHAFDLQTEVDRALAAGGGEVVVPPGEHILKQPLVLDAAEKLDIVGYDKERSILRLEPSAKNADAAVIELRGKCSKVRIRKLTLDGAGHTSTGIRLGLPDATAVSATEIEVSDCIVQNFTRSAVVCLAVGSSVIERCTFMDIGGTAMVLSAPTRGTDLKHNHFARSQLAVGLAAALDCGVLFNEIRDCRTGIRSKGASDARLIGNQLLGIKENGIELLANTTQHEVSSNELDGIGAIAIILSGSGHRVKGNEITGSKSPAVEVREGKHHLEPPHDAASR